VSARHAAADAGFPRQNPGTVGRGVALVVLAVVLAIIVLRAGLDDADGGVTAGPGTTAATGSTGSTDGTTPGTTTPDGSGGTAPPVSSDTPGATVAPIPPGQIPVLVANGTSVQGAAGRVTLQLGTEGYVTKTSVNANERGRATTVVYFAEGAEQAAQQVATFLGVTAPPEAMPNPLPVADLQGATVLVVLGDDLATAAG